jgi:hypothetical protein
MAGRPSITASPKPRTSQGTHPCRLWVEADGSDDMDLFVALQKLDADGNLVGFTFYAFYENGPIALGWQRVSHRALDPSLSTPERPIHLHTREERLERADALRSTSRYGRFPRISKPAKRCGWLSPGRTSTLANRARRCPFRCTSKRATPAVTSSAPAGCTIRHC